MKLHKFLVLFSAGMIILVLLMVWFLPLDDDFRVENPLWNGFKNLDEYAVQPLESYSGLPYPAEDVTLIVVPYLEFTPEELGELDRFIREGGRVILADDYGYGNQALEYLETAVRFSGDTLLDPLANYKSPYLPKIIHFNPDPLTTDLENMGLNHATCLLNTDDSSTLALSSSFSFLDTNENGKFEEGEPLGPLPVIFRQEMAKGELILVADPSLFINSMAMVDENETFIKNIAATTTTLYIDQLHLPPSDLHRSKDLITRGREFITEPLVTTGLVALAAVISLRPVWHRKKHHHEEEQ
jgi:hypothetical protein